MMNRFSAMAIRLSALAAIGVCVALATPYFPDELQVKFDNWFRRSPVYTVRMVFNQPEYVPGDTIHFSAWYLRNDLTVVQGDQVLRADLVNESGNIVQRIRFRVRDGRGGNQIILGDNLDAGIYSIYGYSDWMLNYGVSSLFRAEIKVSGKYVPERQAGGRTELKFHPEGGSLIEGLPNRVVVTGVPGQRIEVMGSGAQVVAGCTFDKTGLGSFYFTPLSGINYRVAGPAGISLPAVRNTGLSIRLDSLKPGRLSVHHKNLEAGTEYFLFALTKGRIIHRQKLEFQSSAPVSVDLAVSATSTEPVAAYVLDAKGNQHSHRLFTMAPVGGQEIKVRFANEPVQKDSVGFFLTLPAVESIEGASLFSVSVIQENLFQGGDKGAPIAYGGLPDYAAWVSEKGVTELSALNDYLVTQAIPYIDWSAIWTDRQPSFTHTRDNRLRLRGTTIGANGADLPDSTMVMAYFLNNTAGYEGYVKNKEFNIPIVFDYFGEDRVFFAARSARNVLHGTVFRLLEDSLSVKPFYKSVPSGQVSRYADYALKRNIVNRSYGFFTGAAAETKQVSPNKALEDEFQGADYSIRVDDYVIFPTMEEFIREVVSYVQVRRLAGVPSLRVYYRIEKSIKYFDPDPLIIIDGVMTKDPADLLSVDPKDLLFIKVINNPNKLAQLGRLGENGVVLVESKKGNLAGRFRRNTFSTVGLNAPLPSANLYALRSGIPVLKSTVYWNPDVRMMPGTTQKFSFRATDDSGPMLMVIQGITAGGRAFSQVERFEIGRNPSRK